MSKVKCFSILLIPSIFFFVVLAVLLASPVAEASGAHQLGFFPLTMSSSSSSPICDGSIGKCLAEEGSDEEFSVDSESTRRMLAYRRRYISYGALSRNRVPCSRRGASYYNCRPGAQANPYRRGCSAITRCRG